MSHWLPQADGSILGAATPRALEWAGGDKRKLAAIGFVAFCRDMQLDPFWASDDWHVLAVSDYAVAALLDTSTDHSRYEVSGRKEGEWFAPVRVMDGKPPVIHILGVSWTAPPSGGRHLLLSCQEWLRAFPIHHVPYTEEDHERHNRAA